MQQPDYNSEQLAAIATALAEVGNNPHSFVEYSRSDRIVQRGAQTFAVFGSIARELLAFDRADNGADCFEYLPLVVDGQMIEQCPDEGATRVAYLMRCLRRRGQDVATPEWVATWIQLGWLYTRELELSAEQVAENIEHEIDQGACHITGGRPGWN